MSPGSLLFAQLILSPGGQQDEWSGSVSLNFTRFILGKNLKQEKNLFIF